MGPFDQSYRQFQQMAQSGFSRLHFAAIILVIVAGQVQQSVQNKNSQFGFRGVPELGGVNGGNFPRDGNVAGVVGPSPQRFKAQDIGRLVFLPVLPIHTAKLVAGGNANADLAPQSNGALCLGRKPSQSSFVNIARLVSQEEHFLIKNKGEGNEALPRYGTNFLL
jgi:hypothetical protein